MTKHNTPALRFAGFDGEWRWAKLGDFGRVGMNKRIFKHQTAPTGDIPFYKIGTFGKAPDAFIPQSLYDAYRAKYPHPSVGTVLISASGSIGRTLVYNGQPAYFQDSNIIWLDHNGELLNSYLEQFYSITDWNGIEGTTIRRLYNEKFLAVPIPVPPAIEEQRAIGELFADLDALIEQHRAKHANLRQTKTALIQRMFPQDGADEPELRLGGFSGAWEVKEFGSVVTRSSTASAEPGLPRLEYEDIVSGVGGLNKDLNRKESLKAGLLFGPGDVLYGKLRPYLKNWLLPNFHGIAVGDFWVLQSSTADPKFVYQLIQTPMYDAVANISSGSKMPRADWKLVSQARIAFPPTLEEQRAIGEVFSNLDALIASEHRYITQLTQAKTALLQRMFV